MSQFTTELHLLKSLQQVLCCCCGSEWEQLWAGAALTVDHITIGYLCPRCLNCSPRVTAERLQEFGETLLAHTNRLRRLAEDQPPPSEELTSQLARLKEESLQRELDLLLNLERAIQLKERARDLLDELKDVISESHRLLQESKQRRGSFRTPRDPRPEFPFLGTLEELSEEAAILISLPRRFPKSEHWPVTVAQLMEAERNCVRQQLGSLSDEELRVVVDQRYTSFLSGAA